MSETGTDAKLIRMANQIATFFLSQPENVRVDGVATHINKFWETRMRARFFDLIDQPDAGFLPLVIEASSKIKRPGNSNAGSIGVGSEAADGAPGGGGVVAGSSLSEPSIPEATA
jgi:formate dehydrogenase subunit delta